MKNRVRLHTGRRQRFRPLLLLVLFSFLLTACSPQNATSLIGLGQGIAQQVVPAAQLGERVAEEPL